ncbi:DegV family protein [Anaerococcus sp. AGMB00486]|uniref:DegV family protein n=1 Tax=Anaerococcus faecalis TaxID=2742993 RepID=A0ABX2NCL8_9FIRM|nr:DegV family protein [Anaerococcus faecalis]NVF12388.1 DegV family protein [Anaerococcus faecalis]
MDKIKIVVDSGNSVDLDEAEKLNIGVIPFKIHFGDETFTDQVDLTSKEFFKKLKKTDKKVTTSIPGVGEFIEILEGYIKEGYNKILCFAISPKLSGMYNMMNLAKDHIDNPNVEIDIINTKIASIPLYFVAKNAAIKAKNNEDYETIYKKVLEEIERVNILARVDTLDYLVKGGRLPKPVAQVASFVNFSPIFTMDGGEIKIAKKTIGKKKSFKEFVKLIKDMAKEEKDYILAIAGGESQKEIKDLKKELREEIEKAKIFKEFTIPPVFGVHLGPGSLLCSVLSFES